MKDFPVIAIVKFQPEHIELSAKITIDAAVKKRQEKGNIYIDLQRGIENPNIFIFNELWETPHDWQAHLLTDYMVNAYEYGAKTGAVLDVYQFDNIEINSIPKAQSHNSNSDNFLFSLSLVTSKEEAIQSTKDILSNAVVLTRKLNGCIKCDLLQSSVDPTFFVLNETWTNLVSWQNHMTKPFIAETASALAKNYSNLVMYQSKRVSI